MQYYRNLYVDEKLSERKKDRILSGLNDGVYRPAAYLIVLPNRPEDQLEIIETSQLRQKQYPEKDFFVVGIAKDQGDAIKMVAEIVEEVYNETGETDVRSYILRKEQEEA